jgi:hypothetical protein
MSREDVCALRRSGFDALRNAALQVENGWVKGGPFDSNEFLALFVLRLLSLRM